MIQSWRDGSASEGRLGQAELSWIHDSQWEKRSGSLELFSTPQAVVCAHTRIPSCRFLNGGKPVVVMQASHPNRPYEALVIFLKGSYNKMREDGDVSAVIHQAPHAWHVHWKSFMRVTPNSLG